MYFCYHGKGLEESSWGQEKVSIPATNSFGKEKRSSKSDQSN